MELTHEHLGNAVKLVVPFFMVITKVDMVPWEQLEQTCCKVWRTMNARPMDNSRMFICLESEESKHPLD